MITALNIIPALQNFLYGAGSTTPVIVVLAVLVIIITLLSIGKFKNPIHTAWFKIIDTFGLYALDYRKITKEFQHGAADIQNKKLILVTGLSEFDLDFMGIHNTVNNIKGEHISWLNLHNETIMNINPSSFMNEHEWHQITSLLQFYRPEQTVNSLVLTIPYSKFIDLTFDSINLLLNHLKNLNSGHSASAYVVVTNVDHNLINQITNTMSHHERQMPIGWSDDGSFARCTHANLYNTIDNILSGLMLGIEQLVASKSIFADEEFESIYSFESLIKPNLKLLFVEMFGIKDEHRLRGIYFSKHDQAHLFMRDLFFNKIFLEDGHMAHNIQNRNLLIFWNVFLGIMGLCFVDLFRFNRDFNERCAVQVSQLELIRYYIDQNQIQDLQIPNKLLSSIKQIKANTNFSYLAPISWIYPIDTRTDAALAKAFNVLIFRNNIARFNQALKNIQNGDLFADPINNLGDLSCIAQPDAFINFYSYLQQIQILSQWRSALNALQASQNPNDLQIIWNEAKLADEYAHYPDIYAQALSIPLPSVPVIPFDQFQACAKSKMQAFANSLSNLGGLGDLASEILSNFKSMQLSTYRDKDFINLKDMLCNLTELSNKNKFDYVLEDTLLTSSKFLELIQIGKNVFGDIFSQEIIEQTKSGLVKARSGLLNNNTTLLTQIKDDVTVKPQVAQIIKLISYIASDPEIIDLSRSTVKVDVSKLTQNPCVWDKNILVSCEKRLVKLLNLEKSDLLECLDPDCKPYFINCLTQICSEIIETTIVTSSSLQGQNINIVDNFTDCMPIFLSIVNFAKAKQLPILNSLIQILQAQALNIFAALYQKPINQQVNGDSFVDPWPQWKEINLFIGQISNSKTAQIEGILKSIFDPAADFDSIMKNISYLVSSQDASFNGGIKSQISQILQNALRNKYMVRLLNIYPTLAEKISSLNSQAPFSQTALNFVDPAELAEFSAFYKSNQSILNKIALNFKNESWYPFIQKTINLGEWINAIYGSQVRSTVQISFRNQGIANNIQSAQLTMNGSSFKSNNSPVKVDLNTQSAQFNQINFSQIAIQVNIADVSSLTFNNQSKTYALNYSGNFSFINLIMNNFNKVNPDGSIELAIPLNLNTPINSQPTVLTLFVTLKLGNLNWPGFEAFAIPQLV